MTLVPHHLPHTIGHQQTWCRCPLWDMLSLPGILWIPCSSEDRVSNRAHRGCREEGRHGVPNRVGAGGWCKGPTVPCLCPLSLLEGDTPCTGQQPLTQWDLGCPGTRIYEGWVDLGPPQGPTQRRMCSSPPWPWADLDSGPMLSEPSHSWMWPPGPWACPTDPGR